MKKGNRLIKINDNFITVEIYAENPEGTDKNEFSVSVLVSSRTFSGSYRCRLNRQKLLDFGSAAASRADRWSELQCEPREDVLLFAAEDDALVLEVSPLTPGKILWVVTCRPFLFDIEVLRMQIETEANLSRAIASGAERLTGHFSR